jgi:hypothetical protein
MLGSEYNWLINPTRPASGVPKVSLSGGGLLTLAVAVFCFLCVAAHAGPAPARSRPSAIHPPTHKPRERERLRERFSPLPSSF